MPTTTERLEKIEPTPALLRTYLRQQKHIHVLAMPPEILRAMVPAQFFAMPTHLHHELPIEVVRHHLATMHPEARPWGRARKGKPQPRRWKFSDEEAARLSFVFSDDHYWGLVESMGWGGPRRGVHVGDTYGGVHVGDNDECAFDYDAMRIDLLATLVPLEAEAFSLWHRARLKDLRCIVVWMRENNLDGVTGGPGLWDLTSHIIGLGRVEFNAVMADPHLGYARGQRHDFVENFGYAIPNYADFIKATGVGVLLGARRILKSLKNQKRAEAKEKLQLEINDFLKRQDFVRFVRRRSYTMRWANKLCIISRGAKCTGDGTFSSTTTETGMGIVTHRSRRGLGKISRSTCWYRSMRNLYSDVAEFAPFILEGRALCSGHAHTFPVVEASDYEDKTATSTP